MVCPDSASGPDLNLVTTMQRYLLSRPQTDAGPFVFLFLMALPLVQFTSNMQGLEKKSVHCWHQGQYKNVIVSELRMYLMVSRGVIFKSSL